MQKTMKHLSRKALAFFLCLCMAIGLSVTFAPAKEAHAADATVYVTGTYSYDYAFEILNLVNAERASAGVAPLTMDQDLLDAAMLRACEQSISFSHTRPDGTTCFTASSKMYGENIAYGYTSPTAVMSGWMNSSGHKANILKSTYTSIGIGCFYKDGTWYWVQCFGYNAATPAANAGTYSTTTAVGVTSEIAATMPSATSGWMKDSTGWWYKRANGSYPANCWEKIDNKWYLFDVTGYMVTGWKKVGGNWYYLKSSGEMATGWINDGGTWYYLKNNGAMATGWIKDGGKWYYLKSSGAMATGWINDWGTWYYLYGNGSLATNTTIDGYRVDASGAWVQ